MDPYARSRETSSSILQPISFVSHTHSPADPRFPQSASDSSPDQDKPETTTIAFMKGPKRKRLAKACDACHKSKRRCDGTAPCSNCTFASKKCTYTDASGRPVPAPRPFKTERPDIPSETRPTSYINYSESFQSGQQTFTIPSIQKGDSSSSHSDDDLASSRKRFRAETGKNSLSADWRR
ncbi:hypothetical protein SERLA73DRAFT_184665 [Serpula lacrymans var. lacrymans S7.3]|uniref:Zn(2)-C6 fungal-type domain-containing protein n=1 Tax=Serpula lacrymans var. lacrymans (strain S7.3) TaxID=936435 RepID=F8Q4W1_SERL3|nr:hypothetical protein SERLA73DRAFT_184665 [Serpula lacrymans var. lacrymans S7.3]